MQRGLFSALADKGCKGAPGGGGMNEPMNTVCNHSTLATQGVAMGKGWGDEVPDCKMKERERLFLQGPMAAGTRHAVTPRGCS